MSNSSSDIQLWEDFRRGEKYALSHIYYLYVDKLFRYGQKFSQDDEFVKDTVQDLFFDLIRTRENLGKTDHIYFYLIKAFRRKLFRSLKGTIKIQKSSRDSDLEQANIIYSIEDEWIEQEHLSEKEAMIRNCLTELSPKQREIIYYRFTCGFEYEQICEIMSMKYDSARKMVFRALKRLRKILIENDHPVILLHYRHLMLFPKK